MSDSPDELFVLASAGAIGPSGWVEDRQAVFESTGRLDVLMGGTCVFGNRPEFRGGVKRAIEGGRNYRVLCDAEKATTGSFSPPMHQVYGTCVGNAAGGAVPDSLRQSLVFGGEFGTFREIAWEPNYVGARVEIGRGQLGNGDGCVVGWIAEHLARHGWCPRGVYGKHDLSQYNENWAKSYGVSAGAPKEVMDAFVGKLVAYRCMNATEIADAIEAKCGVIFGGRATFGPKGANGMGRMNVPSNHSTKVMGWFKRAGGKLGLIGRQSWGPNQPSGPDTLTLDDGTKIDLPDGCAPVPLEDYDWCLNNGGEAWAVQPVHGTIPR